MNDSQPMGRILRFPAMARLDITDMPNRIRHWRLVRDLTMDQLAALIGTTRVQIHRLETGQRDLSISWMRRLATALRCTPAELLGNQDNPYAPSDAERQLLDTLRDAAPGATRALIGVAETMRPFHGEDEPIGYIPRRA